MRISAWPEIDPLEFQISHAGRSPAFRHRPDPVIERFFAIEEAHPDDLADVPTCVVEQGCLVVQNLSLW